MKNKFFVFFVLFLALVGECCAECVTIEGTWGGIYIGNNSTDNCSPEKNAAWQVTCYANCIPTTNETSYSACHTRCRNITQTELCNINPSASGCKTPQQTCTESGKYWYNDTCNDTPECTQRDSTWGTCNTAYRYDISTGQNKPVSTVCKYTRTNCNVSTPECVEYSGQTCDQVLTPDSSAVKCYSTTGSTVYLQNGAGKVWACPNADGSCQVAQTKYLMGDCQPPDYDTTGTGGGGGGSPGSSSSGEIGSSGSVSDSVGISPNDLEFIKDSFYMVDTNFSAVRSQLDYMGADVNHIATATDQLLDNSFSSNQLLQQLVNKDYSFTVPRDTVINNINVGSPDVTVNVPRDTVINNITIQGDTIINNFEFPETTLTPDQINAPDSVRVKMESYGRLADSLAGGFSNYDSTKAGGGYLTQGQLDSGAVGMRKAWNDITSDSGIVSGVSDSMSAMFGKMDIMKLQNGSGACPSALAQPVSFTIPHVGTINAPAMGQYLCSPVAGLNVSMWQIGRVVVRFVVSVLCMFFLFDCATGNINKGD